MKKIISILMSTALLASSFGAMALTAQAAGETIYSNDFSQSADDFAIVGSGKLNATNEITYDDVNDRMSIEGWRSITGAMLKEEITAANFVMEADVETSARVGKDGKDLKVGFIYDYTDANNFKAMTYWADNGRVRFYNVSGGRESNKDTGNYTGASFATKNGVPRHLKLVVTASRALFYVDDELVYSYEGSYTESKRLGLFQQGEKWVHWDNVMIRELTAEDTSFYENSFDDGSETGFVNASENTTAFDPRSTFANGNGYGKFTKYGNSMWYLPTQMDGNYRVDMNVAFENPSNASRYFGIAFGIKPGETGNMTYNVGAVFMNGGTSIEKKTISNNSESTDAGGSVRGSYTSTIPEDKKDGVTQDNEANRGTYIPTFLANNAADTLDARHDITLEVIDGKATLYFEGSETVFDVGADNTSGYIGFRSSNVSARIYSLVITKLADTPEPEEPSVTSTVTKVGDAVTENEGDAAVGYTAKFDITGSKAVNGCTWSVTPSGSDTAQTAESSLNNGEGTTITDSSVIFGLVVTAEKDKAAELYSIQVSAELK